MNPEATVCSSKLKVKRCALSSTLSIVPNEPNFQPVPKKVGMSLLFKTLFLIYIPCNEYFPLSQIYIGNGEYVPQSKLVRIENRKTRDRRITGLMKLVLPGNLKDWCLQGPEHKKKLEAKHITAVNGKLVLLIDT